MRILVIGESCHDIFKYGKVTKLCPEAPCPIFNPTTVTTNDGMAGNVAANLRSLGAEVELITNQDLIRKIRYVDQKSNQMLLREDRGDSIRHSFDMKDVDFSNHYDAVIVSDYDKGFLSIEDLEDISHAHELTFLDTKKILTEQFSNFNFIKINESEWEMSMLAGNKKNDWASSLIVTLGERGCVYDGKMFPPKQISEVRDVAGAGDTFLAALVFKYVETKDIEEALIFANDCASTVVQKRGVTVI